MAKTKSSSRSSLIRSPQAKLLTGVLFLVVLAVGAVVAMALVREPQNTNPQAKSLSCGWCGNGCISLTPNDDFNCPAVMPPGGMVCTTTLDGTGCEAIDESVAKARGLKMPAEELPHVSLDGGPEKLPPSQKSTADFDEDGDVDQEDVRFLQKHFFQSNRGAKRADLNGDGRVNFHDYSVLRSQMSHE